MEGAVQALLEILSPHGPKSRLFAVTPGVTFRALKTPWEQDRYQVTLARTRVCVDLLQLTLLMMMSWLWSCRPAAKAATPAAAPQVRCCCFTRASSAEELSLTRSALKLCCTVLCANTTPPLTLLTHSDVLPFSRRAWYRAALRLGGTRRLVLGAAAAAAGCGSTATSTHSPLLTPSRRGGGSQPVPRRGTRGRPR